MLNQEQKKQLENLLQNLDKEQVLWLSGYLAGRGESGNNLANSATAKIDIAKLSIIYVTETGNGKNIATELASRLKNLGVKVKLKAAEQYRLSDLSKESYIILIASTHGEGEPPEVAKGFYDHILNTDLDLSKLNYSVLALGDTNYKFFCQTGKDFNSRFAKLGGQEFAAYTEFDVDFADHVENWYEAIINGLAGGKSEVKKIVTAKPKKRDIDGTIISNILLNDVGSNKETYHIEIEAEGVSYQAGDVIGIKLGDNSPRLYSISSSPNYHEDEVHLTVARVKDGLCSNYLAKLKQGEEINFYVKPNAHFYLPDDSKDVIMIGPGTGVAPFRSFLFERDFRGASGRNWLFFGEQHIKTDFLYQTEFQDLINSGVLTKIDLAFSRDTAEKIYVQHRLKQKAAEVKEWYEAGAYFYICGDKENMYRDVEKTLTEILGDNAIATLKEEGRYRLDVY